MNTTRVGLGLDFGTESVRAVLVDLTGREVGLATSKYEHGQIVDRLPGTGATLPPHFALQHPADWLASARKAVRKALKTSGLDKQDVIGIGVDFTSCTMLPALADGTPLCMLPQVAKNPYAWPKLWKHHAAQSQTDRINQVARRRDEAWLSRYGGIIGLEWFFPKMLETLDEAPKIYEAAEVWIEAGDWFVWQLVGGEANTLPRSTCQAGYKACWSSTSGYPSSQFLKAVRPGFAQVVRDKMPGRLLSPGEKAGELTAEMAKKLGLAEGTPVSAATIDAHAGVPGAGVAEPGAMVLVLGTSSCHMLNATVEKHVDGVAGVVDGGILPGMFGYETGQAAVGDAFDWVRRLAGEKDFRRLDQQAAEVPPGSQGVVCLDWHNGCRTPLMDGSLHGAYTGLTLGHGPEHIYRATIEGTACGLRWIVETLRDGGVPVDKFVATGGLPHHNPLLVEIYADVLGAPIHVHPSQHGPAVGAAILGVLAAGTAASGFKSVASAVKTMAAPKRGDAARSAKVVRPKKAGAKKYDAVYAQYRALADTLRG